jgi:hypothetical protein
MTKVYWFSLFTFLLIGGQAIGQNKLNFGRTVRQPVNELPRSKSTQDILKRKAYPFPEN